jgi:Trypsin-like peptidase domain/GYF domain 2
MAQIWHVKCGGKIIGPINRVTLRDLASIGVINSSALVSIDGQKSWHSIRDFNGLLVDITKREPNAEGSTPPKIRPTGVRRPPGNRSNLTVESPLLWVAFPFMVMMPFSIFGCLMYYGFASRFERPTQTVAEKAMADEKPPSASIAKKFDPTSTAKAELPTPPAETPVASNSLAKTTGPTSPMSSEEIASRSVPSVCLVSSDTGSGSGFIVGKNLVMTNAHVVDQGMARNLKVHFPDANELSQGEYPCLISYVSTDYDIALLSIEADVALPPLQLAHDFNFKKGQKVIAIGCPGFGQKTVIANAVREGIVSTKFRIDGVEYLELGIAVNPGNSGGPVVNMFGHVIGMVTCKAAINESTAFALPVATLLEALRELQ